jgi:hypothetical protein
MPTKSDPDVVASLRLIARAQVRADLGEVVERNWLWQAAQRFDKLVTLERQLTMASAYLKDDTFPSHSIPARQRHDAAAVLDLLLGAYASA